MKRIESWLLTGLFVAMIGTPIVVFATGTRPSPNQNRPPTPLPEITVEGVLEREVTPQLDAYLEDALIIAPGAVAAEAWTDVAIGDSPSEEVAIGSNGWLYYSFSLSRPCLTNQDLTTLTETVTRAQRAVEATGRTLIVAIAPDKATIVPDFLPAVDTCVNEVADQLNEVEGPGALLTVWDEMRSARANERPIYFRLDTHWTNEGAGVMAKAIVEKLMPGGWQDIVVTKTSTVDHEGDLTVLLGLPSSEPTDELAVAFPGSEHTSEVRKLLTGTGAEHDEVVAVDFSTTNEPVIDSRTLVMHDSYGWALTPMLAPYFETATFIAETDPAAGHAEHDLAAADTIVHVSVQRSLHEIIIDRDLAAAFVAGYANEFDAIEQGTRQTGERLELERASGTDGDLYVVVELANATESAEVAYNDVTAVLTPDSPRSAYHVGSGGTMFFAGAVDYRIVTIGD